MKSLSILLFILSFSGQAHASTTKEKILMKAMEGNYQLVNGNSVNSIDCPESLTLSYSYTDWGRSGRFTSLNVKSSEEKSDLNSSITLEFNTSTVAKVGIVLMSPIILPICYISSNDEYDCSFKSVKETVFDSEKVKIKKNKEMISLSDKKSYNPATACLDSKGRNEKMNVVTKLDLSQADLSVDFQKKCVSGTIVKQLNCSYQKN